MGNLSLNAGWCWAFFAAERPDVALGVIGALDVSTLVLKRDLHDADRAAGALLAPYAAWLGFATALNADILNRNRVETNPYLSWAHSGSGRLST